MFVGGLSWETDEETMRPYFEQFGTVTDCVVMRDPHQLPGAKKNRGFGFVKFEDPAAVERVVAVPVHTLDSKTIDPKKALKKSGVKDTDKKVFIGGLASATTEKQVEDYFNKHYGGGVGKPAWLLASHSLPLSPHAQVMEVVFKVDKSTQRKRGQF
jgi:heterogeneous nuclear ribonucleoprotein A2/B1